MLHGKEKVTRARIFLAESVLPSIVFFFLYSHDCFDHSLVVDLEELGIGEVGVTDGAFHLRLVLAIACAHQLMIRIKLYIKFIRFIFHGNRSTEFVRGREPGQVIKKSSIVLKFERKMKEGRDCQFIDGNVKRVNPGILFSSLLFLFIIIF